MKTELLHRGENNLKRGSQLIELLQFKYKITVDIFSTTSKIQVVHLVMNESYQKINLSTQFHSLNFHN